MTRAFPDLLRSETIHNPREIRTVLEEVKDQLEIVPGGKNKKYYNIACGFDI